VKVHLLNHFRSFLLQAPPYTSTFLLVQEWREPVLVMRVEELSAFQQGQYRARVGFRTWQSDGGAWVVAVPFCLEVRPQCKITGMPCLNPRSAADYQVIRKFAQESSIRFLFLDKELAEATDAQIAWPPLQRAQARKLIELMDASLLGERLTSVFDPDFEQARQEFQNLLDALDFPEVAWER
jgi:hypothetical protein